MFDGFILENSTLKQRCANELADMLNAAEFPAYFREARVTALSKRAGKETVELVDVRPIAIRSHLSKIAEKAVLERVL